MFQNFEEVREGFHAAGGVADREPRFAVAAEVMAAENCKAHGKTVVTVGLDLEIVDERARSYGECAFLLEDILSEAAQFADHASDAISFLLAGVGDALDAGGAGEEGCEGGEGEEGVREAAEVAGEPSARMSGGEGAEKACIRFFDTHAYGTQDIDEGGVALETAAGAAEVGEGEEAAGG